MRPEQYDVGGAQILGEGNFTLVGQTYYVPRTLLFALGPGQLGMDVDIALDRRWEVSAMDRSILGILKTRHSWNWSESFHVSEGAGTS